MGKEWPGKIRGLNIKPVGNHGGNQVNPHLPLHEHGWAQINAMKVNAVRIPININEKSIWDVDPFYALPTVTENITRPYSDYLEGLDSALYYAEKYRIHVILTMANIVGRKHGLSYENLLNIWEYIARTYGQNEWLLGYDLLNEPHGTETPLWRDSMVGVGALIEAIRNIDVDTYFIYEPGDWGNPGEFINLLPINDTIASKEIIYSFHLYQPHTWTHQGVGNDPRLTEAYPGMLQNHVTSPIELWDQVRLLQSIQPVIDFKQNNGAKVLVGEFGATRWALGKQQWLQDTISIFDDNGFDWMSFGYGGWNGWNDTYSPDDPTNSNPHGGKTPPALNILKAEWQRNIRE
jgi:hypothetical protein